MTDCLDAALEYADRGWKVFPLDGKIAFLAGGFKIATTNTKKILRWWAQYPDSNVGIACNSGAGPIIVDLDDAFASDWLYNLFDVPITLEASSGKKHKRHLYFAPPRNHKEVRRHIKPFRDRDNAKIKLDILGDGGYVVAPPSIHPETARRYQWITDAKLAPFPKALLKKLEESGRTDRKRSAPRLPDVIDEGDRDNQLTSLAGTMRRRGASEEAILEALRVENDTRVNPPLPDKDLQRIARSIASKEPAILDEHCTDMGNARRFITQHQHHVRSIMVKRRPWYIWDDQRWAEDHTGEVERMAKSTVRSIYTEAAHMGDEEVRDQLLKHASGSESSGKIDSMLKLAATEPELSTTVDMLDANEWLFNVENGTIDLRTARIRPHRQSDLITKLSPVRHDPKASAPRWFQFLDEIMCGDHELMEFLQMAAGYSLTGDTREHCLFFLYGQGSNGKSTFIEVLRALWGEYGQQADFASFLSRRGEGPRNDIARMRGARFVAASEADSDRGFDGTVLKQLTGGDTVVARKLYEEHQEFKPVHKLWLAANHKPIVREQTEGFWRRIRLIPFLATFPEDKRDKRLTRKLLEELPGILNWVIDGCILWRKQGLVEPKAVTRATQNYREENDILGEFIAAHCKIDAEAWSSTVSLYREFTGWWSETRGQRSTPLSAIAFGRMLGERQQITPSKRHRVRGWKGIAIWHSNPVIK